MNQMKFIVCLLSFFISINLNTITAQEYRKNLESFTREEILQLSYDDLLSMPLEDLMVLAQKMGVSIDELLKMKTSVASRTELSPRESPGIISIVTTEEIRASGAQDLIGVLKLVPGFDVEYDVDGVVGLGFRGNWVHEGKALILLDGQMMNDLVYYNTPFGNHFDVSQIKKIEIVRGPGSAIYGGNAELCVINIITKNGKDINGVSAGITYGQLPKNFGRINGNLQTGIKTGKWDLALKTFVGLANRTNRIYNEGFDSESQSNISTDLSKDGSRIETQNINFSAQREDLSFHFIYDNYNSQCLTEGIPSFNKFRNISSSLQYDFHLNSKLTLTPLMSYQYSKPYNDTTIVSHSYAVDRYKFGVGLNYDASENINVVAGGEWYQDHGQITDNEFGSYTLNLNNMAFYTQLLWKMSGFNLVAGGRIEKNNKYGTAFAPRIGITRVFNKFHLKLLASEAFRSPSIGNIDVSNGLKVEKTLVLETEFGYKINDNMFVTANIFDISIKDPILYYDDGDVAAVPITNWGYYNELKSGSNGIELEYRYKYFWGFSTINYSFYTNRWKTVPEYYKATGMENGPFLGLPQHKLTWLAGFRVNDKITLAPSVSYTNERFGYTNISGDFELKRFDPSLQLNLNLSADNLFTKGLQLDLGVSNIFNDEAVYLQPYDGGYPPYPGRDQEVIARIVYNFSFTR